MLRIYSVVLEVLKRLKPIVDAVAVHDRGHARQMRDAATSIAFNLGEGSGQRGGHRRERYKTALGSTREVQTQLDVAALWGYIDAQPEVRDMLEHVAAVLIRNL